jgi:RND family efflux transporter MFP subunit
MPRGLGAEGLWANGLTEAVNDVTMSAAVIGIVGARPVEEGAKVKQGQVLLELDKRLEELEVTRKRFMRDQAKNEWERARTLAEKSAISISREEMDKKQADFNVASVEHDLASEQLRRRQLIAPFDGVVAEFFLKVGEGCQVQQPLVRLVDPRRCYLVVSLDARIGHGLEAGQKVKLEAEAGAATVPFDGVIHHVSPVVDPASGLMKIKVLFENDAGRVRPGVAGRMLLPETRDAR